MTNSQPATEDTRRFTIGGREFEVSRMSRSAFRAVRDWREQQLPLALASISSEDLAGLSPEHQRTAITEAMKADFASPPQFGSAEWFDDLRRRGKDGSLGAAVCLHATLGKHQDVSLEECEGLCSPGSLADAGKALAFAAGVDAPDDWGLDAEGIHELVLGRVALDRAAFDQWVRRWPLDIEGIREALLGRFDRWALGRVGA